MLIPLRGPLNLAATLDSGQAFRWRRDGDGFHGVLGDISYGRSTQRVRDKKPYLYRLRQLC